MDAANDAADDALTRVIRLPTDDLRHRLIQGAKDAREGKSVAELADLLEGTEVHIHGFLADIGWGRDHTIVALTLAEALERRDLASETRFALIQQLKESLKKALECTEVHSR